MGTRSVVWIGALSLGSIAAFFLMNGCANQVVSTPPERLRVPQSFSNIQDPAERSRAYFLEASRVMLHARCQNCHPRGDSPTQGEQGVLHDPPVARGPEGKGIPAMRCNTCHQDRAVELARVPGAPNWHLAPRSMAWAGRSPGQICEQLKDPARNGHRTLAQILEHAAHDPLVGWAWAPGAGRTPAPGTQAGFGALLAGWIDNGAHCPREGEKP